jgi:hypothetical protein
VIKKEPWRESVTVTAPSPSPSPPATSPNAGLMAAMFGQVGIASIRAAVVDMSSMDMQASWTLSAHKDVHHEGAEAAPDSAFIAARDAGVSLREAPAEYTMVRKLSPRVWSFAWRSGPDRMVIAETRYRDRRDALDDTDTALVRLIFLSFSQAAVQDDGQPAAGLAELEWPAVDRRRGRNWRTLVRGHRVTLLLLGLGAVLALWLAAVALPAASERALAQQAEAARFHAMVDKTMSEHLSSALATGDYGELQNQLSIFHGLGYFQRAVVVNARQRAVAAAGTGNEVSIGNPLPPDLGSSAKPMPLLRGSEQLGQLLVLDKAADTQRPAFLGLWALALACFLALLGAAAVLLLPSNWRPRHKS